MKQLLIILFSGISFAQVYAQSVDSAKKDSTAKPENKKDSSGFDKFNAKAEHLFKILPVPIYSYSPEAGNIFGLAKFNVLNLSKKDTISKASKLSEVLTFSTLGRINASISTQLVFDENKYVIISYVNYKKEPEYIWDIGNTITDNPGQDIINRFVFADNSIAAGKEKIFTWGYRLIFQIILIYRPVVTVCCSQTRAVGLNGGLSIGLGFAAAYDTRKNRYNPLDGSYILGTAIFYPGSWGSLCFFQVFSGCPEIYQSLQKYVIAGQVTTSYANKGCSIFMNFPKWSGDSQMRPVTMQGGLRDNVLVDAQTRDYEFPYGIFSAWSVTGLG